MNIRSRYELCRSARSALISNTGNPKAAVLCYGGITCGLALVVSLISFALSQKIAGTSGLSSLGLRSVLSTVQYVLPLVQMAILMCLELGYQGVMLNVARNRPGDPRHMREGFYRFGPLFRSAILQFLIYTAVIIACVYFSAWLFMILPVSDSFYQALAPILEDMNILSNGITLDEATLAAATSAMAPMIWIFLLTLLLLAVPVFYRYRMVSFCLMDDHRPSALAALRESRQMMRKNRFALFLLDLRFWWYYLLQVLVSLICYGDVLLPMLGVTLPWSDTVSYFLFYILSLILQFVISYFFMNQVQTTYATAYDALRPRHESKGIPLGNIFDLAREDHPGT